MTETNNRTNDRPFFPGPRRDRPFSRGDFKYILLQHIKEKPSYGYEIIRALQERFHSFYVPSPGSVYPTLQLLEEMGYATTKEEDGKKVYTVTEEGTQYLEEQKESRDRIKKQIRDYWNPENIDDIMETMRRFDKLGHLLREKARTADVKKLGRMQKALSRAYEEISKD